MLNLEDAIKNAVERICRDRNEDDKIYIHVSDLAGEAIRQHAKILHDMRRANEEAQELTKAKAEGRLVVLPCKAGTRVWAIGQDCDLCHDMYTEEPCLFGDCEYRKVIESVFLPGMTDEFGKTVFLTREEAEKALQEGLR
jgi:hypothetical protein